MDVYIQNDKSSPTSEIYFSSFFLPIDLFGKDFFKLLLLLLEVLAGLYYTIPMVFADIIIPDTPSETPSERITGNGKGMVPRRA